MWTTHRLVIFNIVEKWSLSSVGTQWSYCVNVLKFIKPTDGCGALSISEEMEVHNLCCLYSTVFMLSLLFTACGTMLVLNWPIMFLQAWGLPIKQSQWNTSNKWNLTLLITMPLDGGISFFSIIWYQLVSKEYIISCWSNISIWTNKELFTSYLVLLGGWW